MHLRKYGNGWTRRYFLEKVARGIATAGVIRPLWGVVDSSGTCEAAYPPELLSIEAYTKGKLKTGDVLSAANVDLVKELLDPATYHTIKDEGRVCDLVASTTELKRLNPDAYIEATLRNRGVHQFGQDGNV